MKFRSIKKFVNIAMVLTILLSTVNPGLGSFVNTANAQEIKKAAVVGTEQNISLPNTTIDTKIEKSKTILFNSKQTRGSRVERKKYVEGEIIVKYRTNKINLDTSFGRTRALDLNRAKSLERKEDLRKINAAVLKIKDNKTIEDKIAELKKDPNVEYAQPNFQYYPTNINTNDTNKNLLWGLDNTGQTINVGYGNIIGTNNADINAPEAWAISETTTSAPVIVAVIDTGVAYNHPDLTANMWDGTSCKDENGVALGGCNHGYDFESNDKIPLPTSNSHGTHIAGIIAAAKGNGLGIIGVAPQAKIMAIKSSLTTADNIKSINFAKQNGAKVINASWGAYGTSGVTYDIALYNAISSFPGLFVTAAGNEGFNFDDGVDGHKLYPSGFKTNTSFGPGLNNIIAVAATDQNDTLASFSNYGATSIDVGAPGTNIYSAISNTEVFSEDFEGSTFKVSSGGMTPSYWKIGHDGSSKVAYSESNYPYKPDAHTWLTQTSALDLSVGNPTGATMSFVVWCNTPPSKTFDDFILTTYFSNGSWHTSTPYDEDKIKSDGGYPWTDNGNLGYYKKYTEDISNYLTNDFMFSFDWYTNSSIDSNLGCTIDDIKITKYSDGTDEKYGYMEGTSMAAPHVAGLAALIEGYNPNLSLSQVKNTILSSGDSLVSLAGKTVTGKRINAQKALQAINPAKAITAFTIPGQVGTTTIDEVTHTITLTVPSGTNVSNLVPTIVITGATVDPVTGVAQNFTSPITYTVTAADGSVQPYVVTVVIAPATTHTISGTVKYYDGVKVVPNAIVKLETDLGLLVATTTTDNVGYYQFIQVPTDGNYSVSISKDDKSAANGVSALDLIKIRRHVTSLEIFDSIYKISAADVNNSNSISALDLIKIRRYVTSLEIPPITWRFYDSSAILTTNSYLTNGQKRTYANLTTDSTGQDFIGVKLGDVNNSWISQ